MSFSTLRSWGLSLRYARPPPGIIHLVEIERRLRAVIEQIRTSEERREGPDVVQFWTEQLALISQLTQELFREVTGETIDHLIEEWNRRT
jgi:hypothetical protein